MSKKTKKTEKAGEEFAVVRIIKSVTDTCRETVRDYNENYVKAITNTGREFGRDLKRTGGDLKQGLRQTGRELGEGAKKDARMIADRVVATAKKSVPGISGIETVEGKIRQGFRAIADRINLPSKAEMEKLNEAMETLGGKVEVLAGK